MSCYQEGNNCHKHKKSEVELIINLIRIFVASLITGLSYIKFQRGDIDYISLTLTILAYLIIGYDTIIAMIKGWLKKEFFNESFLMVIATVGAFIIGEYQEACLVLILYHIGELLKNYVFNRANKSVTKLIDVMPIIVHRFKNKDEIEDVPPDLIQVGDILQIRPGERVSIDGVLLSSCADLDQSSLTGESLPLTKNSGEEIYSGSINLNTIILVKATKEYQNSTMNSIIKMIFDENNKKAKQEKFIRRFSKIYTPIVCLIALVVFITLYGINGFADYQTPLYNALNILIIACPCSLVISIPLAIFMGIGKSSKLGVLIKGGAALENASRAKVYCFDIVIKNKDKVEDEIKDNVKNTIAALHKLQTKTVMLSGDNEKVCAKISKVVGFDSYYSSLLPQEKLDIVHSYQEKKNVVAFVDNGINGSTVLIGADLRISIDGLGSEAAIDSSDIVIMNDDISKVAITKKISKKVLLLIYENIVFIFAFKLAIIIFAVLNLSNMILSIGADVGVMILTVLNSLRISSFKANR